MYTHDVYNPSIGVQSYTIHNKTITSETCDFLLPEFRFDKCIHIRASMFRRTVASSDTATSTSSHTNYSFLTTSQIVSRLQSMHDQCRYFHSKVEKLQKHVTMMIKSKGVGVNEELHSEQKVNVDT